MASGGGTAARRTGGLFWLALAVGLLLRIGVFAYAIEFPIVNEDGTPVSPTLSQRSTDFYNYIQAAKTLSHEPLRRLRAALDVSVDETGEFPLRAFTTPVLPLLILATGYEHGHTLPLSTLFLAVSCATFVIWLLIFRRFELPPYWSVLFALLPTPLWFTVNMTLDTLLAFTVAVFFWFYFIDTANRLRLPILALTALLTLATRPNGAFIMGFVIADAVLFASLRARWQRVALAGGVLAGLTIASYLLPLFMLELMTTSRDFHYFGYYTQEYLDGIYPALPAILDRPLSWLSLTIAKALYFCGFRPSFSDIGGFVLLVRAAPGLLLFPGLVYLIVRGDARHKLFFLCFAFPIFLHLPQERYSLAVLPLMLMYGGWLMEAVYARWRGLPGPPDAPPWPTSSRARNSTTA